LAEAIGTLNSSRIEQVDRQRFVFLTAIKPATDQTQCGRMQLLFPVCFADSIQANGHMKSGCEISLQPIPNRGHEFDEARQ
jgi:hypothetical protein